MDASLSFLVLFLSSLIVCYGQRCDNNRLRRCREDVARQSERRRGDLSKRDCREFRENFDCLLDQAMMCLSREDEREDYGQEISRAHDVLREYCDREEGWDRNRCYQSDEIRRCEDRLPRRISVADSTTCRKYEELKECVENVIRNSCTQSDRAYLRSYYVDIARILPWKCNAPTSQPGYSPGYPSYRPDDNYGGSYNNRNRSYDSDQKCCKLERCEDRNRLINCRQDLIKIIEGRSNIVSYNNNEKCRTFSNKFNCLLWHTYSCQQSYEKDTTTIKEAKNYIMKECSIKDDLQRSRCYNEQQMRDCDRHLQEETPSEQDVTCREYASYFDCFERQLRSCSNEDEFLQGFYLTMKAGEKAWTCSKKDTNFNDPHYTPYSNENTYPYGGTSDTTLSTDDENCKRRASRDYHRCLTEKDKMEDEARRTENTRERRIKTCCVVYSLRECVRQIVRQACDRERSSVVNSLMGSQLRHRLDNCQDINQSTCSASQMINNAIIIVLAVAIFRSVFEQ